MNHKSRYINFCSERQDIPLFLRPEWMDAVCVHRDWDVVLAEDKGGKIIGALPFQAKRKWGMTAAFTPLVTPHSGPWLSQHAGKPLHQQISSHHQVVQQCTDQLDRMAYKNFKLAPGQMPGHAWHWSGYQLNTRYTYRLSIDSIEQVFNTCKNTIRTDIRNAEKELKVQPVESPNEFHNLLRTQIGGHYQMLSRQVIENLFSLKSRFPLTFTKALRGEKTIGGALFVVDGLDIYYLIGSRQTEGSNLALTALIWDAITKHAGAGKVLDFEGTMLKKVEPFFRRFGGVPTLYLNVVKMPRWMKWLRGG